ncbi:MAG: hypothetical protein V4523_19540 [Pseudomonadota bacterium]
MISANGADDDVGVIDVWDIDTFDNELRGDLDAHADLIRDYMITFRGQSCEHEASDHRMPCPENPHAGEFIAGAFTKEVADRLFADSPYQSDQLAARSGKFWMTSHPVDIEDGGVEILLESWGRGGRLFLAAGCGASGHAETGRSTPCLGDRDAAPPFPAHLLRGRGRGRHLWPDARLQAGQARLRPVQPTATRSRPYPIRRHRVQ